MSFKEELSRVDADRMAELLDELFRPGNKHSRDFWLAESTVIDQRFPVFKSLLDKYVEIKPAAAETGYSEEVLRGIRLGIDLVRMTFGVYAETEVPDRPPETGAA